MGIVSRWSMLQICAMQYVYICSCISSMTDFLTSSLHLLIFYAYLNQRYLNTKSTCQSSYLFGFCHLKQVLHDCIVLMLMHVILLTYWTTHNNYKYLWYAILKALDQQLTSWTLNSKIGFGMQLPFVLTKARSSSCESFSSFYLTMCFCEYHAATKI